MTRVLAIAVLCGCAGSLVDQSAVAGTAPTAACLQTCTSTAVAGAAPLCIGDTCTYECPGGKLKCAAGCCDVSSISAGASHTCAVAGGEARCWGANDQGQLGRIGGSSFVPVQAAGIPDTVTAIAAGSRHTCAVAAGQVWCWGDNTWGQLAAGSSGASTGGATPRKVANLTGILSIAAGGAHSCAADASHLYCWGRNDAGQLGIPSSAPGVDPTVVQGIGGVLAVAAGDSHTCAIASSGGGVFCWGANQAGQAGTGSSSPSGPPSATSPALAAAFLGLGANHSCGGDSAGKLSCWGANASLQVDNSGQDRPSPLGVLSGVRAVAGGIGHTCALTTKQTVRCWGLDDQGQLGPAGSNADVPLPGVQAVAAGFKHTCALQGGAALCWGMNDRGQLGADPASAVSSPNPLAVSGR